MKHRDKRYYEINFQLLYKSPRQVGFLVIFTPNYIIYIYRYIYITVAQVPKKITRWERRMPRIQAANISTKWLHHHILLSIQGS